MVGRRRLTLVLAAAGAASLIVAGPASGAFSPSQPNPLRSADVLRLLDVAALGRNVAVGWREGNTPGELIVAVSTDGGASYLKENGRPRNFRVAGEGRRGLALDICAGVVWTASSAAFPGDVEGDTDVLVSRKVIRGGRGQAFVTVPSDARTVRRVDVACVGDRLLAIAWLERSEGRNRARLLVRDQATLAPAVTSRLYNLGPALPAGGISVASSGDVIHVAWATGPASDVRYRRILVAPGDDPLLTAEEAVTLAREDALLPALAVRGQNVVLAYTDGGKLKARVSTDHGAGFGAATTLLTAGTVTDPSRATSAAINGARIVIEAQKKQPKDAPEPFAPVRLESIDTGAIWRSTQLGNRGPRFGALEKVSLEESLLKEAWHDNAPGPDTLRAQYEVP